MKKVLLVLLILLSLCVSVCASEPNIKFPEVVDDYKYYLLTEREFLNSGLKEYTLAFSNSPIYIQRVNGYVYYLRSTGDIIYYTLTYDNNSGAWTTVKYHTSSVYVGSDTSYFNIYFLNSNYDLYYHSSSDIKGLIQYSNSLEYYENQRNLRTYFTGWFNNVLSFKSFTFNYFIVILSVFCLVMFIKRFFYRLITS